MDDEDAAALTGQVVALITLITCIAGSMPRSVAALLAGNVTTAKQKLKGTFAAGDPVLESAMKALAGVETALFDSVLREPGSPSPSSPQAKLRGKKH